MPAPLVPITFPSIYNDRTAPLPTRMARCAPDTANAIFALADAVHAAGGKLFLSDLYRSYDMQLQSHLDWVNKKKKAFSPPPGGSLHEAGRAMDIDLDSIGMTLGKFWKLAEPLGFTPIIDKPVKGKSESWHFDRRGSHHLVYEYYERGLADNFKPYAAMAASAIVTTGVPVDFFGPLQKEAALQFGLVRLGFNLGDIDGVIGPKTKNALAELEIVPDTVEVMLAQLEEQLRARFPGEYAL